MNKLERRLAGLTFAATTLVSCAGGSSPEVGGAQAASSNDCSRTFSPDIRQALNNDPIKNCALFFLGTLSTSVDSAMKQMPAHLQTSQNRTTLTQNARDINQCLNSSINYKGVIVETKANDKLVHFPMGVPCTFDAGIYGFEGQLLGTRKVTRQEYIVIMSNFDNKYWPTQAGIAPGY